MDAAAPLTRKTRTGRRAAAAKPPAIWVPAAKEIPACAVCHKGLFERRDDVSSVAYWYQTLPHEPFAPLPAKEDRHPR